MPKRGKQFFRPGQTSWPVIGLSNPEGVTYAAEALALFAAWTAADTNRPTPPSVGQKLITNTLITSLKSLGLWTGLDLLYDTVVQGSEAAKINWKVPASFPLTLAGSPTHTPFRYGFHGDGTDNVLRTGFVPTTNGVNFTRNSHSLIVGGTLASQDAGAFLGNLDVQDFYLFSRYTDNTAYAFDGGGPISVANLDATKLMAIDRSGANAWKLLIDGVQAVTGAQASVDPSHELVFLAGRDTGAVAYSTGRGGDLAAGRHYTDAEHLAYKTARATYMSAKNTGDLIVYTGTSYGNDLVDGPALFVAADARLSTATKAMHVLLGGASPGAGKTSTAQLAEWTSTIKPLYSAARHRNVLVIVPGDADKADGSSGETTIAAMVANIQAIVTDAVADGWRVVVTTTPSWSYVPPQYTVATWANHQTFVAGLLAMTGVNAFCDLTGDSSLYGQNVYLNTTYFKAYPGDAIPHPNATGYARWGTALGNVVQTVR